jgi:GTPase SAR1 family protein
MRHVVIEGMDGSGKTTLVNRLTKEWRMQVHPRSTPSVGGPPVDLDDWADMSFGFEPGIFDRHCLISEPIYGPVCRFGMVGRFNDGRWLAQSRVRLAGISLVIFCEPAWSTVCRNIQDQDQMAGVKENALELYTRYTRARKAWTGPAVRYDYTAHTAETTLAYARSQLEIPCRTA